MLIAGCLDIGIATLIGCMSPFASITLISAGSVCGTIIFIGACVALGITTCTGDCSAFVEGITTLIGACVVSVAGTTTLIGACPA